MTTSGNCVDVHQHSHHHHQLSSSTLHYLLSLTDLLVREFAATFRLFCQQNKDDKMTIEDDTLLKEVYTVVVRQLKRRLLVELQELCRTSQLSSTTCAKASSDLDANTNKTSDTEESENPGPTAQNLSNNDDTTKQSPQDSPRENLQKKLPLLSRLSFRRKMNKGKSNVCLHFTFKKGCPVRPKNAKQTVFLVV